MNDTHMRDRIYIPRWVLVLFYIFFALLSAITAIRGSVTLEATTPASYTPYWCVALALGAVVAVVSTVTFRFASVEKWAAVWIAGWLSVVAVNAMMVSAGSGWLYVALVAALPAGRALGLFSKRVQ